MGDLGEIFIVGRVGWVGQCISVIKHNENLVLYLHKRGLKCV